MHIRVVVNTHQVKQQVCDNLAQESQSLSSGPSFQAVKHINKLPSKQAAPN